MKIYNTATRTIEPFVPLEDKKVGIYCCGPTVYNFAHIGNMRTYVFEDILRRTFEGLGYEINHVMNITDVGHLQSDADDGDDKMSLAAAREQKSPWDIAKAYEGHFFRHAELLGIKRPNIVCRATEHIQEIIDMVQTLLDKGYAYEANGNVYFEVEKFPEYAEFAKLQLSAQQATERVAEDPNKRHQTDFCLWFSNSKYPNQIMKWHSPWGEGFPGWHIECSAMAAKYLGDVFDIHCGGVDHIPVHHTNEIAQSNCAYEKKCVRYWMHGEFLTVDSSNDDGGADKMAKSAGNFLTVDSLIEKGFSPLAYRYFLLCGHYRGALRFSFDALEESEKSYRALLDKVQTWQVSTEGGQQSDSAVSEVEQNHLDAFWDALSNDLRTPAAIQILWNVARAKELSDAHKLRLFLQFDAVLGLGFAQTARGELDEDALALLKAREQARAAKDWAESDRLRDALLARGIQVKDTPEGSVWSRVSPLGQ